MIICNIIPKTKKGIIKVCIDGHSGYAENGKDIVCSAVTALAIAFASAVPSRCLKFLQVDKGCFRLEAKNKCFCRTYLKIFICGMEYIQNCYPQYLIVTKKEKEKKENENLWTSIIRRGRRSFCADRCGNCT